MDQTASSASDMALFDEGCLTVPQAVEITTISRSALYNAMSAGELAFVRRGRRRLIPRKALVAWLAQGLVTAH